MWNIFIGNVKTKQKQGKQMLRKELIYRVKLIVKSNYQPVYFSKTTRIWRMKLRSFSLNPIDELFLLFCAEKYVTMRKASGPVGNFILFLWPVNTCVTHCIVSLTSTTPDQNLFKAFQFKWTKTYLSDTGYYSPDLTNFISFFNVHSNMVLMSHVSI